MKRIIVLLLVIFGSGLALPYWTLEDLRKAEAHPKGRPILQSEVGPLMPNWQTWSYIHELCQTAGFIASMQVTDTLDPEFGGIIEGEDQLNIVQTDNTQEAIWVFCRYYEITGDTTYLINLRRAWIYVMNFPAYNEEGSGSDYYRVWNCGLALFAESKYRNTFHDSTYMPYADTCARYMMSHPLPFNDPNQLYKRLHPKVTSLAGGMLYQYAKEINNQTWKDTALLYGDRVKAWIEQDPNKNINDEVWAMSGGTCIWGMCRSIFDADTTAAITWLNTYLPLMKYYQPTGTWNNSWNIWYANAYNHAARITGNGNYVDYHHSLTDSLLVQDYDDDGGVPPTMGWGEHQDHSWVSSYMVFMGFEGLMDSIKDFDAGVNGIYAFGPRPFFLVGDTIQLAMRGANYGFSPLNSVHFALNGPFFSDTIMDLAIGEEDTIRFPIPWVPNDTGYFNLTGYADYTGDERVENDTLKAVLFVRPLRLASGYIRDKNTGAGVYTRIYFQLLDDSGSVYFDSTETDSQTGVFNVYLIDSLYRAFFNTEIPYPDYKDEDIYVTPDSISVMQYNLLPADLAIINRDNLLRYEEYYTSVLDSLGVSYKVWAPEKQGIFPVSRMNEFNHGIIIWYTGDAVVNTVTPAEQESLITFLDGGGKLLITGQNIGEEISGSQLYTDYLHARLINDSIKEYYCYPDTLDSLGRTIGKLCTTGPGGAMNQYSRDEVTSDSISFRFLYYDSLLTNGAGVWFDDPVKTYQVIYCGFGIEAVTTRPNCISRKELIAQFLRWFGMTISVEELTDKRPRSLFGIFPNPTFGRLNIRFGDLVVNKKGSVKVYDATGRVIRILLNNQPLKDLKWDLNNSYSRQVPNGVYFVRLQTEDEDEIRKVVIIK